MSQPTTQTQEPQGNPSQPSTQQSPQPPQAQPPQQNPTPTPNNSPSHSSGIGPGQQILEALNALPEKLVNAMREGAPPPSQPQTQPQKNQQSSGDSGNTSQSIESKTTESPTDKGKAEPGNPQALGAGDRFRKWWWGS